MVGVDHLEKQCSHTSGFIYKDEKMKHNEKRHIEIFIYKNNFFLRIMNWISCKENTNNQLSGYI
mgnify:CR=1 FL=1